MTDLYTDAAEALHREHCDRCRTRHEEDQARYAAYGASIQRRDHRQLGLNIQTAREVTP